MYIYIYIYVYTYKYIYIHTHIYTQDSFLSAVQPAGRRPAGRPAGRPGRPPMYIYYICVEVWLRYVEVWLMYVEVWLRYVEVWLRYAEVWVRYVEVWVRYVEVWLIYNIYIHRNIQHMHSWFVSFRYRSEIVTGSFWGRSGIILKLFWDWFESLLDCFDIISWFVCEISLYDCRIYDIGLIIYIYVYI